MTFIKAAVASGVLALVFTATAAAQNLRASIPFNFAAGDRVLPAGEYSLVLDRTHHRIEVRSVDGPEQLYLFFMYGREMRDAAPALVFATYGDAQFLRTVRGTGIGFELHTTKKERAMARQSRGGKVEVALQRTTK